MAQRYHSPVAHERMANNLCPECGLPAAVHSGDIRFWVRPSGCSLLPYGVTERIEQFKADQAEATP